MILLFLTLSITRHPSIPDAFNDAAPLLLVLAHERINEKAYGEKNGKTGAGAAADWLSAAFSALPEAEQYCRGQENIEK